jgi:glyoxylase-like metal-dependent hydrolase (beta-lactamase superfamily II)
MFRKAAYSITAVAVLVACAALGGLLWEHRSIRRHRPALPTANELLLSPSAGGPLRVAVINTASQRMPRSAVLDSGRDRHRGQPYVMSHPAFVLEWEDGRMLLVDAGMTRRGAAEFGAMIELMGGAAIEPHGSIAEHLGAARRRVSGVVFTHLHIDHVDGISDLCLDREEPLRIPMTEAQAQRPNYTTSDGLSLVHESPCTVPQVLAGDGVLRLPGFPGVSVVAVGGHTPGTQVIVARLQEGATYVFAGDVANHIAGVNDDIPKPSWYRLLVVPEDEEQLGRWRRLLRSLRDENGAVLLLSHDQFALNRSGVPEYAPPPQ